ncbi:MAG: acetyl-CoA carboxylase biotin carboxyl carrier protein [Acidobacteriota bacterium]
MSDEGQESAVDLEQIRRLIDLLIEKDVAEFEIDQQGVKVKIRRMDDRVTTSVSDVQQPTVTITAPAGPQSPEGQEPESAGLENSFVVTSPMVGTFYRAPDPSTDPFVDVGDLVVEGQTLCIVEAMKLMNEIASEISGEILAILVDNGEPVEFGQQLFAIRPQV